MIAGGTGFIGKQLQKFLIDKGYEVAILARKEINPKNGVNLFKWDIDKGFIDKNAFDGVSTIINLTGANVGEKYWTESQKREILKSRIEPIELLKRYVKENNFQIETFISASATGYYGAKTTNKIYEENDENGKDFLAQICSKWEKKALEFDEVAARVIILRIGVVLGKEGGFYKKTSPYVQWGINSAVGSGKQFIPWIDIFDLMRMFEFIIENKELEGVYNAVSSQHLTMNEISNEMLKHFGKSSILPNVPSFIIRILFGEMSEMILNGTRISNEKIKNKGFVFLKDNIEKSLLEIT